MNTGKGLIAPVLVLVSLFLYPNAIFGKNNGTRGGLTPIVARSFNDIKALIRAADIYQFAVRNNIRVGPEFLDPCT